MTTLPPRPQHVKKSTEKAPSAGARSMDSTEGGDTMHDTSATTPTAAGSTTTTIDRWRLTRAVERARLECPDEDPPTYANQGITRTLAVGAKLRAALGKLTAAADTITAALADPDRLLDDATLRADLRAALSFVEGLAGGGQHAEELQSLCIEGREIVEAIELRGELAAEERERARAEGARHLAAKVEHRKRVEAAGKIAAVRDSFLDAVRGNPHAIGEALALLALAAGVDPVVATDITMAATRPAMDAAHQARALATAAVTADRKAQS